MTVLANILARERRCRPDERAIDREAADVGQRVPIHLIEIPRGELACERAGKIDRCARLCAVTDRVAVEPKAIEWDRVQALVAADLRERPQLRREIIGCAQRCAVLVVVAVSVAHPLSIDEDRWLLFGAIEAGLERDVEPVEALADAGAGAHRRVDREVRKTGLDVRAARVIGGQDETTFKNEARQ